MYNINTLLLSNFLLYSKQACEKIEEYRLKMEILCISITPCISIAPCNLKNIIRL